MRRTFVRVTLVAFVLLLAFDLKVLSSHGWDPLAFVLLTPDDLPEGQTWGVGYDGRFVYHIAANPLGNTIGLDEPNFRYQRILYPLLVKVLSLGNRALVPWMMLWVNLSAGAVGLGLLGALLERRKVAPWWAFVLALSMGFLLAIRMDLLEPLALALAFGGLLMWEEEKPVPALVLFVLASLAKELALLVPAALMVFEIFRKRFRKALALAVTAVPYVLLYIFLVGRFGLPDAAVEKSRFLLVPFSGFAMLEDGPSRIVVGLWVLLPAVGFGAWALWDLARARFQGPLSQDALLVLAYAALLAVLPGPTWIDPLAIVRWALGLIFAVLLWSARGHPRLLPVLLILWAPSGLLLAAVPGML